MAVACGWPTAPAAVVLAAEQGCPVFSSSLTINRSLPNGCGVHWWLSKGFPVIPTVWTEDKRPDDGLEQVASAVVGLLPYSTVVAACGHLKGLRW
ncbi:hypothetical protein R6Q59_010301 [Mikania micrantha]